VGPEAGVLVFPSGLTYICTVTDAGISCAFTDVVKGEMKNAVSMIAAKIKDFPRAVKSLNILFFMN